MPITSSHTRLGKGSMVRLETAMLNLSDFAKANETGDGADAQRVLPAAQRVLRVLVFSSQKGGSGKTTLCGQLAVQAELSGDGPVAVVDTDPQGSLAQWWNARTAKTPLFLRASGDYLHEDLGQLERSGVRYVFIDTPPAVTEMISRIVAFADLVVVPTRPSPHDLRAVGATLDIVERHRKPVVFAINAATRRARITGDTAVALSQHGTVAPVTLHHRTDFATSMIHGETVVETCPDSRSSVEIAELWKYLAARLDEGRPKITRGTGLFQRPHRPRAFGLRRPNEASEIRG
jgi:chromosome partitioning protein